MLWHAVPMTDLERQLTRRRLLELGLVLPPLAVIAGRTDLFSSPRLPRPLRFSTRTTTRRPS